MKQLVVTADDFGLSPEVNDAVERANRNGILTAASLMVAAPGAADAVARARRLPRLQTGLHLVLVEGTPALPPDLIPDLVDDDGRFRTNMVRAGIAMALRPVVQRQLADEIKAQFELYRTTGLPLQHVDAHKHFHLHPMIARLVIAIGRDYGMTRLRVPVEPVDVLNRIEPTAHGIAGRVATAWAKRLRTRVRDAQLTASDNVFGLAWSGAMNETRMLGLLQNLPAGRTEIYTHPATDDVFEGSAPGYRYRDEFAALISPACVAAVREAGLANSNARQPVGLAPSALAHPTGTPDAEP